jgi:hypothetical protein
MSASALSAPNQCTERSMSFPSRPMAAASSSTRALALTGQPVPRGREVSCRPAARRTATH